MVELPTIRVWVANMAHAALAMGTFSRFFLDITWKPDFVTDSAARLPTTAVILANLKPEPVLLRVQMAVVVGTKDTLAGEQTSAIVAALKDTVVTRRSTVALLLVAPREKSMILRWVFAGDHESLLEKVGKRDGVS